MYSIKVKFGTAKNAALFVGVCGEYDCDVDLKYKRYSVDGKSILGVMSISPENVCEAILHSDDRKMVEKFNEDMKLWTVEKGCFV